MTIKLNCGAARQGELGAFSIAEVVISAALMGLMIVSVFAGMGTGFSWVQLAREDLRATQIMLEKTEIIRLYSWDQINGTNGFVIPKYFTAPYYPNGLSASSGVTYNGVLEIGRATLPNNPNYSNSMRQVNVTVQWVSGNATRTRSMTTLVGQNGLQNYIYN